MPAVDFTESVVELAALEWFGELGYTIGHGPDLEPGGQVETRCPTGGSRKSRSFMFGATRFLHVAGNR
jgi:hypothetical protein